jgi:rfaE bifunctional protein nucleotidyltransferase chain/domain
MRLGFTNGVFDGLHPGHRFFLQKARETCSWLIVAINTDESVRALKGQARPIIPLEARLRDLYVAGLADAIVPFHGDPVPLIQSLRPDVLIRGEDQSDEGAQYVQSIVRVPRLQGYSTTEIL